MTPMGSETRQQVALAAGNGKVSRVIENGLAVLGGLLATAYVVGVEIFPVVCASLRKCAEPSDHQFPWMVAFVIAACVAPKTIGRASAGKVWEAIASKFGSKT